LATLTCFLRQSYRDTIDQAVDMFDKIIIRMQANGIVFGYEDLNDHNELRCDPVHGLIAGKSDPLGQDRILDRDKGNALAGHATLNRLELPPTLPIRACLCPGQPAAKHERDLAESRALERRQTTRLCLSGHRALRVTPEGVPMRVSPAL
jgi:hypothetical protein